MKEILENVIKALVDNKDEVKIIEEKDEFGFLVYRIDVAPEDMGRIIGKKGKTIKSLRTLFRAAGLKNQERVKIELVDEDRVESERKPENSETKEEKKEETEVIDEIEIPEIEEKEADDDDSEDEGDDEELEEEEETEEENDDNNMGDEEEGEIFSN